MKTTIIISSKLLRRALREGEVSPIVATAGPDGGALQFGSFSLNCLVKHTESDVTKAEFYPSTMSVIRLYKLLCNIDEQPITIVLNTLGNDIEIRSAVL